MHLYTQTAYRISALVTKEYSTSFFSASRLFDCRIQPAIYSIYGFVRYADEIVDTFNGVDKKALLDQFEQDFYAAMVSGISLNPILHAFQHTVKTYAIPNEYIQAFLGSMKMDLIKKTYASKGDIEAYIYGSADVVGLMCLKVFCGDNVLLFDQLKAPAIKLGTAFQKVNFLRDLKNDTEYLERTYFPNFSLSTFDEQYKAEIIKDIAQDFAIAYQGIKLLPKQAKLAVLVSYYYYTALLNKLKRTPAQDIVLKRIRVKNSHKFLLVLKAMVQLKCNYV